MTTRPPRSALARPRTWSEFKRWCAARGLKPLPAHPWTIAAYLRWVDRRGGARDAHQALDAITREHLLKTVRAPARHPVVLRTLELIARRNEVRGQHAALFDERDILEAPAPNTPETPDEGDGSEAAAEAPPRKRRVLASQPRLTRKRPRTGR